MALGNCYAD